jgi:hypothetical protein
LDGDLQAFQQAIHAIPQASIHIASSRMNWHPLAVPVAVMWMEIELITGI